MQTAGSIVRLTYDVYDESDVAINPTAATIVIVKPDGVTVTPALTVSLPPAVTGHLVVDYTTVSTMPGRYTVLWATSNPFTTKAAVFNVGSQSTQALLSLDDAKRHLNIDSTEVTDDEEISDFVDVASEIVVSRVGACAPQTVVERCEPGHALVLRKGPQFDTKPTVIEPWIVGYGETVDVLLTQIDPVSWLLERTDGAGFWCGDYKVTHRIGRQVVPHGILHGCRVLLAHLWETQRGRNMVGPASVTEDADEYVVQGRVWTVPKAVMELLDPFALGPDVR